VQAESWDTNAKCLTSSFMRPITTSAGGHLFNLEICSSRNLRYQDSMNPRRQQPEKPSEFTGHHQFLRCPPIVEYNTLAQYVSGMQRSHTKIS
jgi:hypothetical protein